MRLSSRSLRTNFCPAKAMSNFVSANKANTPTQNDCTNRNSCATVNVARGELILEGRNLQEIPKETALDYGRTTKLLNLKENCIMNANNIDLFTNLTTLILDKNDLTSLAFFPVMPSVKTLWFNNNRCSNLNAICQDLSRCFPNLEYLSMLNNPCCPAFYDDTILGADKYRRYRLLVSFHLKKLRFLDATPISQKERSEANSKGQFLGKTAKPTKKSSRPLSPGMSKEEQEYERQKQLKKLKAKRRASSSLLGIGNPEHRYDGKHSEGNRFITNNDL
eukprot:g3210.t1